MNTSKASSPLPDSKGRDEDDLAREVDRSREDLLEAMRDLRLVAEGSLSPVQRIREHPYPFLLGGLVLGLWLGARGR